MMDMQPQDFSKAMESQMKVNIKGQIGHWEYIPFENEYGDVEVQSELDFYSLN